MLKKTLCIIIAVMCLIPSLAVAGKNYNPTDIYHGRISVDDTIFTAGDKINSSGRISVKIYYADIYDSEIEIGNGTIKSVVIDGEKVTEWKIAQRTGAEFIIGRDVRQAAYGFTLKPAYAFPDSDGCFSLTDKTYEYLKRNMKDKKVKFI